MSFFIKIINKYVYILIILIIIMIISPKIEDILWI